MAQNLDPLWTNRNGWRLWQICFCDRNDYRGAEKLLLKRNHWFLALCLEEVVRREENYQ